MEPASLTSRLYWAYFLGVQHPHFETAVDAVVAGDSAILDSLLGPYPDLVHARSERPHQATLLHYVGANGVEDERQKTPPNAVEIARRLLQAGAEVDAVAPIYGASTALGLVATSGHPRRAGVQIPLLQLLLDHGASVDGVAHLASPLVAALANGRPEAAEYLALHGAQLDLEGAAGLGRLDLVQTLPSTAGNLHRGFLWACEYGRNPVVSFLLDQGFSPESDAHTHLTAFHWAIVGGHLDTIQLLIKKGASLTALNQYGGNALGCAHWCMENNSDGAPDYAPVIELLVQAGAC